MYFRIPEKAGIFRDFLKIPIVVSSSFLKLHVGEQRVCPESLTRYFRVRVYLISVPVPLDLDLDLDHNKIKSDLRVFMFLSSYPLRTVIFPRGPGQLILRISNGDWGSRRNGIGIRVRIKIFRVS